MAKLFILNPLAMMGARMGYNRPLDRRDFSGTRATNRLGFGGHIPGWAHDFVPNSGELKRFANLSLLQGPDAAASDSFSTNQTTTKQLHPLGTIAMSKDGRIYRYSSAGAADLVVGNIVQSAAPIPLHLALTSAAQAVGDGRGNSGSAVIVVTPGGTGGAANLYAEGTLMIDTTPGNGFTYRISGHAAITASVAFNLFLDPDETIQVALTTASRYGLHHNPWKTVIQTPTTNTAKVIGCAVSIITANTTAENFGWVQTRGPAAVLINGTPAITAPVVNSGTTPGAVDKWTTAAADVAVTPVGFMMQVGVSGKNNSVFLTID